MPVPFPFSFLGGVEAAWAIPRDTGETDDYWGTRVEKAQDAPYYAVAYSGLAENPFGNKFDAWVVWTGATGLVNDWFQLPGIDLAATPSVFDVSISDDGVFCLVYWRTTGWGEIRLFKRSGNNTWSLLRDMKSDFSSSTSLLWHCVLRDRYIHGSAGNNMGENTEWSVFRIEPDGITVTKTYNRFFTYSIWDYGYRYWMGDITSDGEFLCQGVTQYRWSHSSPHTSIARYSWLEIWKANNPGRTSYTRVWNYNLGYGQHAQLWWYPRFSRDKYHIGFGTYSSNRFKIVQRQDSAATNWTQVASKAVGTSYNRGCDMAPGRNAMGNIQETGPPYDGAQPTALFIDRDGAPSQLRMYTYDDVLGFVESSVPLPNILTDPRPYDGSLELTAGGEGYRWDSIGAPFDNLVAARISY
jgi:hypothetical protein